MLMPRDVPLTILYEDNHCLAVDKPNRLLTMGDATGERTLLDLAKDYIKKAYGKPGAVFLGVVHRLDRPVSGVVLFARTSKAAARLSEQFRERTVDKVYRAIVEGMPPERDAVLQDWLWKDPGRNVTQIVSEGTPGAQQAALALRRLKTNGSRSLVEVKPVTGRSHQIRVQLASRGGPILGDAKYGSTVRLDGSIALHAYSLTFRHPTKGQEVTVTSLVPDAWGTMEKC
jgi:23S rRNA pseudouridine1911/1915/1917 synthase